MGLLDGDIAKAIFAGFKGKLLAGEVRRESAAGGLDEHGDPVAVAVSYTAMEGFTDEYSDFYRAQLNIPDTDLKVNIFAQSAPGFEPTKDDKVRFGSKWYQLRKIKVDPAGALWECQAFEIEAPIDAS